ncbi:hypothetical protein [Escherichia coli]|uniref:hypothetical protein n=1 Tax=Escherichia coli TaxID=562 RepID=UPI00208DAAEC|nr:hypothetical protein [Escherichia coli]
MSRGQPQQLLYCQKAAPGGFSLPVSFDVSPDPITPDTLPQATDIQERLTTFAQKMRLKLTWQEIENTKTDEEGRPIILPWNEYGINDSDQHPAFNTFR